MNSNTEDWKLFPGSSILSQYSAVVQLAICLLSDSHHQAADH